MGAKDPFNSSVMAYSAAFRLAAVAGIVALLWIAVAWGVALP